MEDQKQLDQKLNENKGTLSDPTSNVLMVVEAATKRQDDLRIAEKEKADLRQEFTEKLIDAKFKFKDEKAQIRDDYQKELRVTEKERIDAIRTVDVAARQSDNDKAIQQAAVLANQLKQTEDNLQSLIRQQATAQEARLAALEKSQYENKGKDTGKNASWVVLVAVISVLLAFAGFFLK